MLDTENFTLLRSELNQHYSSSNLHTSFDQKCFLMARVSKRRTEETRVSLRDLCQNRSYGIKFIETLRYGTNLQRMNYVRL